MLKYLLIILIFPIVAVSATFTFGDSSNTTSGFTVEDTIRGSIFISPENGVIDSVNVRLRNFNTPLEWKVMIYKASDRSLIGTSNAYTMPGIGWVDSLFTFSSKPTVKKDTAYLVCAWSQAGGTVVYVGAISATGDSILRQNITYGTPPDPFVRGGVAANYHVAIKCYGTIASNSIAGVYYSPAGIMHKYTPAYVGRRY